MSSVVGVRMCIGDGYWCGVEGGLGVAVCFWFVWGLYRNCVGVGPRRGASCSLYEGCIGFVSRRTSGRFGSCGLYLVCIGFVSELYRGGPQAAGE